MDRKEITVISPANDGESLTIVGICRKLNVDVRVSEQPWGATLDKEPERNLQSLKHTVIVVEMPSVEAEEALRAKGHNVIVVDHHHYAKYGLDRRKPDSSLEQVAAMLGYELSRLEKGMAINDRSYIYGLLDAGYSSDEILAIRLQDLEAQGVTPEMFEAVRKAVACAPVRSGIKILRTDLANAGFAQDFLVLQNPLKVPDLLILTGDPVRKAQFYGDPQKVAALEDIGEWSGGSGRSRYWGTNHPRMADIFLRLNI